MNEERIISSIKNSIENAPIDLLDKIKSEPIQKMIKHDDITRQSKEKSWTKSVIPIMSLAASLVFIFGLWQFQYRTPDSFVYLDVNPSVELVTNKKDEVIDLASFNDDGEEVLKGIQFKGRDIVLVTEELVMKMIDLGYIDSSDDYLLLSVYNEDIDKKESQKERLNTSIHSFMEKTHFSPIVLVQNLERTSTIEDYAKEYGISWSKMTFIRNMIILNPNLQVEDLVGLSLTELITLGRSMKLDLESIIQSDDFERIPEYTPVEDIQNNDDDDDDDDYDDYDDVDDDDNDDNDDQQDIVDSGVVSQEKRIISYDEARRIALSLTGGGTIASIELDHDDDKAEYEIEIINDGKAYDIEIDGYSGKVLDFEVEDDD